jgi:hypothetical protein
VSQWLRRAARHFKFAPRYNAKFLRARFFMERVLLGIGGGLMSYGPNFADAYQQVGIYTGRMMTSRRFISNPKVRRQDLSGSNDFSAARRSRGRSWRGRKLPSSALSSLV